MKIYLVGGAVRDALLGQKALDRDWVVVGATSSQMQQQGFRQVGKDFPVFLHPETKEEFALARTERKTGSGYHGFEVESSAAVTLEEDLKRRDLTINAMAQDDQGQVIDPFAGQADLQARLLRHVSPAFSEDPLRVLRVARFAAKLAPFKFKLAPETKTLMTQMVASGELADLTPERVWQEVEKALQTQQPAQFFVTLDEVGALALLFPELTALKGVSQPHKYHPEGDVWTHTLMVLQAATRLSHAVEVRFAALVHDLGKGLTPPALWPSHKGHEAAGVPLVQAIGGRYRLPKKLQELAQKVTEFHGLIHKGLNQSDLPSLTPSAYLQVLKDCGAFKDRARFYQVLQACEADAKGRLGYEASAYPQAQFWMALRDHAEQVDNQAILATGVTGAQIGHAIEQQKLDNIKTFCQSYSETPL